MKLLKLQNMYIVLLSFFTFSMIALTIPAVSSACSPPRPGISNLAVHPPTKTNDVPLNGRIIVRLNRVTWQPNSFREKFEIRPVGGSVLQVTPRLIGRGHWKRYVFTFSKPLKPNTTYEVLTNIQKVPCSFNSGSSTCAAGKSRVISTFQTGTKADNQPPQFKGLKSITPPPKRSVCPNSACCGPYDYGRFSLGWDPATDETSPKHVLYNVYRLPDLKKPLLELVPTAFGIELCSGHFPGERWDNFTMRSFPINYKFVVRAVDLAGNEDTNTISKQLNNLCGKGPKPEPKPEPTPEPKPEPQPEPTQEPAKEVPGPQESNQPEENTQTPDEAKTQDETPQTNDAGTKDTDSSDQAETKDQAVHTDHGQTPEKSASGCSCSSTSTSHTWLFWIGFLVLFGFRRKVRGQ